MNQTNDELEISLSDVLRSIWDIRWIVVVLALLGGIIGTVFSTGTRPSFVTKASMLVTARTADGTYQNGNAVPRSEDIYLSQNLTKTVQLLSTSNRVLKQVLDDERYNGISPEELKSRIQVTAEDKTAFLWLTLSWEDQEQAVTLLNCLMDVLPQVMTDVMDIGSVNVIDRAEQAVMVQEKFPQHIGAGVLIGFVLGCSVGILYYLFVPKVRGYNSLDALPLDMIGEIPSIQIGENEVNGYLDEGRKPARYQEAYGRLAAVFGYLTEHGEQQIIAVTSSVAGEGKSTISYNLALRLTEMGNKVLLLDFDFKKGVLYQLVKTRKPKDGDIRTQLRNGENLDQLVEKMYNGIYTIQGFSEKDIFQVENKVFPAIRQMKNTYDYIIIDTPPVGVLADVQLMRGLMDGVLLVIRQDMVPIHAVTESITFLEKAGIPVTGGILNRKKTLGDVHFKKYD